MKYVLIKTHIEKYIVKGADSESHAWDLVNESIDEGEFNRYLVMSESDEDSQEFEDNEEIERHIGII